VPARDLFTEIEKAQKGLEVDSKAARVSLSTVSHAFKGKFVSVAAVTAAEQLLAKAAKR
jgi:hypothetical protein